MGILIQLSDDFDAQKKDDIEYFLTAQGYIVESVEEN